MIYIERKRKKEIDRERDRDRETERQTEREKYAGSVAPEIKCGNVGYLKSGCSD